jgi:hypothetical protein
MKFPFFKKIINDIVVLGRGTSKEQYFNNNNNFLNIRNIMLVNYSESDFHDDDLSYLINKKIHILFNICEPHLSKNQIETLDIASVHIARTKSMRFKKYGRRQTRNGNIYGKIRYLSNEINKYWYLNNCGLLGIAYATKVLKAQRIILFGFDFYQDEEFLNRPENLHIKGDHPGEDLKEIGKNIKLMFLDFVNDNPSVDYLICSNSDFQPTSNLHLIE